MPAMFAVGRSSISRSATLPVSPLSRASTSQDSRSTSSSKGMRPIASRSFSDGSSARASRPRSEEHTSELQSHSDLHSFPTRRSSDLGIDVPGLPQHVVVEGDASYCFEVLLRWFLGQGVEAVECDFTVLVLDGSQSLDEAPDRVRGYAAVHAVQVV